jgi:hypothetical protein
MKKREAFRHITDRDRDRIQALRDGSFAILTSYGGAREVTGAGYLCLPSQ